MENTPRIRINAKQTSKGAWYFEATAETDNVEESSDLLIKAVKRAEDKFKEAGKLLVGEYDKQGGNENPKT